MAVYLAFPMLLALVWSRWLWAVPAVAGAAALYWLAGNGHGMVSEGLLIGDFIRGFAGFTFGLLCFRAFTAGITPRLVGRFDLAIVAAFWAAAVFSPTDLPAILLCPAIILSLAFGNGPLARLLGLAPLHYLGQISYSVYLAHYCVLRGLNLLTIPSPAVYGMAAFLLTIALSTMTYRWIERPARGWITEFAAPVARPR
jgi:peptidoglycan/LPS O-acetylase OafA/YrhL